MLSYRLCALPDSISQGVSISPKTKIWHNADNYHHIFEYALLNHCFKDKLTMLGQDIAVDHPRSGICPLKVKMRHN